MPAVKKNQTTPKKLVDFGSELDSSVLNSTNDTQAPKEGGGESSVREKEERVRQNTVSRQFYNDTTWRLPPRQRFQLNLLRYSVVIIAVVSETSKCPVQ